MAAMIYTFKAVCGGLEDKIWRKLEVSSLYPLDKLGYCILATFDALAYHLFSFSFRQRKFCLPDEWDDPDSGETDISAVRLEQLDMKVGDVLDMDYDFGTAQAFHLQLISVVPMKRGTGAHYPRILDGAGRGVIDDRSAGELAELINQIDRTGATDEKIYYNDCPVPWDYRRYSPDTDNALLKGKIERIAEGYLPFWDN